MAVEVSVLLLSCKDDTKRTPSVATRRAIMFFFQSRNHISLRFIAQCSPVSWTLFYQAPKPSNALGKCTIQQCLHHLSVCAPIFFFSPHFRLINKLSNMMSLSVRHRLMYSAVYFRWHFARRGRTPPFKRNDEMHLVRSWLLFWNPQRSKDSLRCTQSCLRPFSPFMFALSICTLIYLSSLSFCLLPSLRSVPPGSVCRSPWENSGKWSRCPHQGEDPLQIVHQWQ